jgi:hypothetical protein
MGFKDELADLQEFLEIDCGSVLQIVGEEDNIETRGVQLIHETFRSFLVNEKTCPPDFCIDLEPMHRHITVNCLDYLATNVPNDYIARFWTVPVGQVTLLERSLHLLTSRHRLFISGGLKRWINYGFVKEVNVGRESFRTGQGTTKLEIRGGQR